MTSFNKYAQYPTVPGIVIVKNTFGQQLFVMSTDNIRVRIKNTDVHNNTNVYRSWGEGRKIVGDANKGQFVFTHYEMPNTSKATRDMIAEAMDKESLSKQIDTVAV
jgi:hypothetical protein